MVVPSLHTDDGTWNGRWPSQGGSFAGNSWFDGGIPDYYRTSISIRPDGSI